MGIARHRMLSIDLGAETGVCALCGPVQLGYVSPKTKTGPRCGPARQEQRNTPNRHKPGRRGRSKGRHGLYQDEAQALKAGKACAICGGTANLVIDHCHRTGVIRGVLCSSCNAGLGMFGDSTERLVAAIEYLTRTSPPLAA